MGFNSRGRCGERGVTGGRGGGYKPGESEGKGGRHDGWGIRGRSGAEAWRRIDFFFVFELT